MNIFEAAGVKPSNLPTATAFSLGLATLVALGIDITTIVRAPPSMVPDVLYQYVPFPSHLTMKHPRGTASAHQGNT